MRQPKEGEDGCLIPEVTAVAVGVIVVYAITITAWNVFLFLLSLFNSK